jgi:hypothetical protein
MFVMAHPSLEMLDGDQIVLMALMKVSSVVTLAPLHMETVQTYMVVMMYLIVV